MTLAVAGKIKETITHMPPGKLFTYSDLSLGKNEFIAASKSLERLIKNDKIRRFSKGIFYLPQKSIFGELLPDLEEVIRKYTFTDGVRTGYLSGDALFRKMGLSTQMPSLILLAVNEKNISIDFGSYQIRSIRSRIPVNDKNYRYLQILDVINSFKRIQDLDSPTALGIVQKYLKEVNADKMISLSLAYPPRCRALLGALLEFADPSLDLSLLKDSLNPFTKYKMNFSCDIIPGFEKWRLY